MDYGTSGGSDTPVVEEEIVDAAPEEAVEETTATLPSGLFAAAPKKGDVLTLRVVNVFDGEVEVAAQSESSESGMGGEMISADEELDQMAQA